MTETSLAPNPIQNLLAFYMHKQSLFIKCRSSIAIFTLKQYCTSSSSAQVDEHGQKKKKQHPEVEQKQMQKLYIEDDTKKVVVIVYSTFEPRPSNYKETAR